jgi:hypothetical protein
MCLALYHRLAPLQARVLELEARLAKDNHNLSGALTYIGGNTTRLIRLPRA